jgi:hypothetical protein
VRVDGWRSFGNIWMSVWSFFVFTRGASLLLE